MGYEIGSNFVYVDGETSNGYNEKTSPDWKGPGWYRMGDPAGTMLSEEPVPHWHCNTGVTTWLMGQHPTTPGEAINGKLCLNAASWSEVVGLLLMECYQDRQIQIKYCSNYFLYYLEDTSSTRYCSSSFSKSLQKMLCM